MASRTVVYASLLLALTCTRAAAQEHHGQHRREATPYAAMIARDIKGLSAEQVADLRAGRGMGLALSAELNGYPGPVHVIEHAAALNLSPEQRRRTEDLVGSMKAEAIPIGVRLIEAEATLDRDFREGAFTPAALNVAVTRIATLQGDLRAAHLRYHLAMVELLTPVQVARYNQLRGYVSAPH